MRQWRREELDVNSNPSKRLGRFLFLRRLRVEVCRENQTPCQCSFYNADGSASRSVEGDRGKRVPGDDTEGLRLRDRESWGLGEIYSQH